jgi:hypothetical protein
MATLIDADDALTVERRTRVTRRNLCRPVAVMAVMARL